MANPRIEVEIGANVAGLTAGVNSATSNLDRLGKAASATAPQIQKLSQATSGYNSIGVDFARIVQDAPFGIIGVGNNIQQLAGSFQVLKNQTGSTSAALKQSFASIFSSGNALVLGISLLTTAFTILQQKGFFKSEEAAKSLNEQLDEYRENLEGVSKATLEGATNAQKELSSLKLLQTQAENTNLSIEKRLAAVNDLKKQYPEYLQNLTDEQILAGNVGNAYKSLTTDILSLAKAKAFSSQIDKNTANSLTLLLQEEERAVQILQKRAELQTLVAQKGRGEQGGQFVAGQDIGLAGQIRDITKEIDSLTQETVKSAQERAKIAEQNLKLEAGIVGFSSQGASFAKVRTEEVKKTVKENENLKRTFEDLSGIDPLISFTRKSTEESFFSLVANDLDALSAKIANVKGIYQTNITGITQSNQALVDSLSGSGIGIEQFYAAIANGAAQGFSSLDSFIGRLSETQAFVNKTFDILEQGAENTLGDMAFAIGDALASGGNVIKAAGGALLGGLAGILNQLGQLAIATGLAVEGIKTALKTLNPAVAIGAGIALIALAGFVSNKAKSLGSSRGGGGGGGGGGSSVGSSGVGGGTSFAGAGQGGLFQQNRDLNGELVVRGQDLVYVFGQASNRINKG
jgi:chorismate mutase